MIVSISCKVTPYSPNSLGTSDPTNKIQRIKQVRTVFSSPRLGLKDAKDMIECIMAHGKVRVNVTEKQLSELRNGGFTCANIDLQEVRFNDAAYYQNRKLEAISAVCVGEWSRARDIISELMLLDGDWDVLNEDTNLNFLMATPLETED
jgi:hypothetical protein